ncbi:MAG: EFR1 family ferrodoxin [Bacteroidaceae bacterium]|nr:EFR1 family ferrodoxin [Bacteroidaceae bacterium]
MVYCFSGTGNSRWVADKLEGLLLGQRSQELSKAEDSKEVFGLVFPVYAWGIPKVVEEYIGEHLQEIEAAEYVYAVMTCGDDIGYADTVLKKRLNGRLDAVFSVHMPNTYVCLPGFDVDKDEVAARKVRETLERLPQIAKDINERKRTTEVCRGGAARLKTYVLRPLFNRFLVTDKYFHTTKNCFQCKRCVRGCPLDNITTDKDGHVVWKHENCTGCLRCYHRCPAQAVQFGWFTKNKGQKIHDFD